jgi:hypothetical protein
MTIGHAKDWLTVHTSAAEITEGIRAFKEKRPIDYKKLRRKLMSMVQKLIGCWNDVRLGRRIVE